MRHVTARSGAGPDAKARRTSASKLDRVIVGDCLVELARLPDACVDLVFADPPYNLQLAGDLGTPKPGRIAARAGRHEEMKAIFEAHLEEPAAQLALAKASEIAAEQPAALLCYETDPLHCHRLIVADRLVEAGDFQVEHLFA